MKLSSKFCVNEEPASHFLLVYTGLLKISTGRPSGPKYSARNIGGGSLNLDCASPYASERFCTSSTIWEGSYLLN